MKKLNVIIVYDKDDKNILMCKRAKEPYMGLFNLVGGQVEEGEDELSAAYRELFEETGITKEDITLTHLMNFSYMMSGIELEIFVGRLKKEVTLIEEVNKLYWLSKEENYYDLEKFAGEGNIGHMLMQVEIHKDKIFKD